MRCEATHEKIRRAQNGDAEQMDELVRENIALVKYIVKRYLGRGREYDDLFQLGCLGLVKAIRNFNSEYDVQFSTYAVPVIMGEIRRYLRDDGAMRVTRTLRERAKIIMDYIARLEENGLPQPSVAQISEATGLAPEDVVMSMNALKPVRSLDERIGDDGSATLKDIIGVDVSDEIDKRIHLRELLKSLPEDERRLIVRRYINRETQSKIARELGISQVQVSRMESKVMSKLREAAAI